MNQVISTPFRTGVFKQGTPDEFPFIETFNGEVLILEDLKKSFFGFSEKIDIDLDVQLPFLRSEKIKFTKKIVIKFPIYLEFSERVRINKSGVEFLCHDLLLYDRRGYCFLFRQCPTDQSYIFIHRQKLDK